MKKYWLYRITQSDGINLLLLKHGYILIDISGLLPSEKEALISNTHIYPFLKFNVNDIIVVPTEGNTISFFKIKNAQKPIKDEWNKIKSIFKKSSNIEYITYFERNGFDDVYVVNIIMLKEHIPMSECTDMEFAKYVKERRTSRDISRFSEEIESILNDSQKTSDTSYLLKELLESNNIKEYIDMHKDSIRYSDPVGYLQDLLIEKGLSVARVGKYSGQGDYVYKIFKGEREPSRDVLLSISIGMRLSLDETQRLLKLSKIAELNVKDSRDAIIIFGILKNKNVQEVNDMLYDNHKSTLFY